MKEKKERLDIVLQNRGFFPSREKAKAAVMAGVVLVDGVEALKPGTQVYPDAELAILEPVCPYVGRGGLKLAGALEHFSVDPAGAAAIDIGASTGGFTDCLLKNGAKRVYAVDVGYGQLDWKLRNDPRVVNMERINIRLLKPEAIPEKADIITVDVSFISLRLVLPVAAGLLRDGGSIICLVKPQFEAGRAQVGKKGIVKDPAVHEEVIRNVIAYGGQNGLYAEDVMSSPIRGAKGNVEFLLLLRKVEISEEGTVGEVQERDLAEEERAGVCFGGISEARTVGEVQERDSAEEERADACFSGISEERIKEVVEGKDDAL